MNFGTVGWVCWHQLDTWRIFLIFEAITFFIKTIQRICKFDWILEFHLYLQECFLPWHGWWFLHKPLSFLPLRREWLTRPTFCSQSLSSSWTELPEGILLLLQLELSFFFNFLTIYHYWYCFEILSYYLVLVVLYNSIIPSFAETSFSSDVVVLFRRQVHKSALSLTFSFSFLLRLIN